MIMDDYFEMLNHTWVWGTLPTPDFFEKLTGGPRLSFLPPPSFHPEPRRLLSPRDAAVCRCAPPSPMH